MAEAPRCGDCGGKLGVKATKCRCGWVMPGAPRDAGTPLPVVIACCYSNCAEGAICRVFTPTGWANVCRTHYPTIELSKKSYAPANRAVSEGRKAYEGSFHYRQRHGGEAPRAADRSALETELEEVRRKMAESRARQPGQDDEEMPLGISLDPLEAELEGRANP